MSQNNQNSNPNNLQNTHEFNGSNVTLRSLDDDELALIWGGYFIKRGPPGPPAAFSSKGTTSNEFSIVPLDFDNSV